MKGDLDLIKNQLQDRVAELCRKLLPDGRDEGGQWVSFNPVTSDKGKHHNPTLKVRLRGGVAGAWKDWRSGAGGDVIGLVEYVERTDTKGALAWSRDFLGLQRMSPADRGRLKQVAAERAIERDRENEQRRVKKLIDADRLFRAPGGDKPIGLAVVPLGTFEYAAGPHLHVKHAAQLHAEAYYEARKIPLREISNFNDRSLRFSPQTEWWKGASWDNSGGRRWKTAPGPLFPAVHAAMRNKMGIVTCCHVTFLDPVKPGKAPVDLPKLMFGEAKGAVIEISTGPSGIPFWLWKPGDPVTPVILTEGKETGMSFGVAGVPARVWACGSLNGIGSAPIDHPCVGWVMFARDNNDGNPIAQKAFAAALEQLEQHGKTVVVEGSHVGDDFNDLAKGEE